VGSLTSHNPIGLQGLLRDSFTLLYFYICQDQKDQVFNKYSDAFVSSLQRCQEATILLQIQYILALFLKFRVFLRNYDTLGAISMSGPFSKLNIQSTGYWWNLEQWEMPSWQSRVCDCGTCYIGKTSRLLYVHFKEHKYNLTHGLLEESKLAQHAYEEGHKICWKDSKGPPDWTKHHLKEIQGIRPHVSGSSSDQSTQPRQL
jgi:hypothetical protein